ncbi:hypothetical protein I6F65_21230, partial [Pseudoalteromonas sp. SWXJZ94C]|uniref:hypothetical protein n=1 Tax=Pseudoalteromonas sp. SWXJZ94C TaxID=2792065 RepID=UPI0018CF39CC
YILNLKIKFYSTVLFVQLEWLSGLIDTRGSRKTEDGLQAEQGSPEYRESIITNMKKKIKDAEEDPRFDSNSDKYDPKFEKQVQDLGETLDKLLDVEDGDGDGELISTKLVSQRLNDDGSLKLEAGGSLKVEAELSSFKNDKWVPNDDKKTL